MIEQRQFDNSEHVLIAELLGNKPRGVGSGRKVMCDKGVNTPDERHWNIGWMPLGCMTINLVLFTIIASSVCISVQVHLKVRRYIHDDDG